MKPAPSSREQRKALGILARAAAALAPALGLTACGADSGPGAAPAPASTTTNTTTPASPAALPRLVVLMATCSLDRSFLEPYDRAVTSTPALAALARDSIVFERHVTEAGLSGIAYAALFTGAQADRHGIYNHPSRLGPEMLTIFEAFAAAGWETHYYNGHRMASADFDYAQGVAPERVHGFAARRFFNPETQDEVTAAEHDFQELLARLAADPELHALVVINFQVTHSDYTHQLPPPAFADFLRRHPEVAEGITPADQEELAPLYGAHRLELQWDYDNTVQRLGLSRSDQERLARLLRVNYRADVELLDTIVGRTLATLARSPVDAQTLFAFTSDHGEYLFHEGRLFQWGHGLQLAPEELTVPWILRPAHGALAPGRYAATTRSIDVFPTLAGLCGVPIPREAPVDGVDLSPALRGEHPPPRLLAPSHTRVMDERLMQEFAGLECVNRYFPSEDPGLMWVSVRDGDAFARWCNRGDGTFAHQEFDLASDPLALHDRFDARNPEHAERARWLEAYKARLVAAQGRARGVDAAEIEDSLRALGYVR